MSKYTLMTAVTSYKNTTLHKILLNELHELS